MLRAVRRGAQHSAEGRAVLEEIARGPINSNPIMSGYIAGVLIRETAAAARGESGRARGVVERCRSFLAPLAAAAGDRLFWGQVRPALSLASLLPALFCGLEAAVLYCLGYNAAQIWWRRRALAVGLRGEQAVRDELRGGLLERASVAWRSTGRLLLGALAGVAGIEGWFRLGPAGAVLLLATGLAGWRIAAGIGVRPTVSAIIGIASASAASAALAAVIGF